MSNNFCFFLSFKASPYFQLKKLFHIYFFIVFSLNNASKSYTPFMEIFFSHDKFSMESPPAYPPLLNPSPNQKDPPENACTLPNNHYYM